MNKIKLRNIIDATIIAWLVIWLYYVIFNWDIFIIKLDTNLGFAVIGSFPFVFFFLLGLIFLIVLRYFDTIISMRKLAEHKDLKNDIALLKKDIEVFKLRETVYKMQSEEMSRNDASLQALHQKLDELSSGGAGENQDKHDPDIKKDRGET